MDIGFLLRTFVSLLILSCAYAHGVTGQQMPLFLMSMLMAGMVLSEARPGKPYESALLLFPAVCAILVTVVAGHEQTPLAAVVMFWVYLVCAICWVALDIHHFERVMMAHSVE